MSSQAEDVVTQMKPPHEVVGCVHLVLGTDYLEPGRSGISPHMVPDSLLQMLRVGITTFTTIFMQITPNFTLCKEGHGEDSGILVNIV